MTAKPGGGTLKGVFGIIEALSAVLVGAGIYHNIFAPRPVVISANAKLWYAFTGLLCVLGAVGLVYTQWIRYRIRNDPSLTQRYIDDRAPSRLEGDIALGGANLSPLKKW